MPFDEKYFSTHTYADVSFAKYSQYWWSNRFFAMLARRYGKKGARLLEIGSGLGHLAAQLEDTFHTFGMDLNHWAVKQSKPVIYKTDLQTASAQELPFADASFNVVIIKHIVEHLPQPEKAIREIGRVTEPGGTLILATPNLSSLLKPWKGERWIGYQDPTHISLKPPAEWLSLIQLASCFRRWFLGCALHPRRPQANPKTRLRFIGRFAGHHGICLPPDALGREYHCDSEKKLTLL
jgi:2-polyprenyl-3-methyl-5-hydroxy-6-metoxy-1,4-benzoquinol methylase